MTLIWPSGIIPYTSRISVNTHNFDGSRTVYASVTLIDWLAEGITIERSQSLYQFIPWHRIESIEHDPNQGQQEGLDA